MLLIPHPYQWSWFDWNDLLLHSFIRQSTNIYSKSTLHINPCWVMGIPVWYEIKHNFCPQGSYILLEQKWMYTNKIVLIVKFYCAVIKCQALHWVLILNLYSRCKSREYFYHHFSNGNMKAYKINFPRVIIHEDLELKPVSLRRQTSSSNVLHYIVLAIPNNVRRCIHSGEIWIHWHTLSAW